MFSIWLAACGGGSGVDVAVAATAEGRAEVIKSIDDHQVSTSHTHQNRLVLNWTNTHNQPLIINGSNMTWRFHSLSLSSSSSDLSLVLFFFCHGSRCPLHKEEDEFTHYTIHVRRASFYVENLFNEYSLSMIQSKPIEIESDDEMKWNWVDFLPFVSQMIPSAHYNTKEVYLVLWICSTQKNRDGRLNNKCENERESEWGRASQGKKQIIKSRINRVWHSCAQSVHSLEWDQILIGSSKNETWKHFIERERQPSKICTKKIKHTRARLPEN